MATNNIMSVIQTVLAAQLVARGGILDGAVPPVELGNGGDARTSAPVTDVGAFGARPKK
jgi:hypothetical protein